MDCKKFSFVLQIFLLLDLLNYYTTKRKGAASP